MEHLQKSYFHYTQNLQLDHEPINPSRNQALVSAFSLQKDMLQEKLLELEKWDNDVQHNFQQAFGTTHDNARAKITNDVGELFGFCDLVCSGLPVDISFKMLKTSSDIGIGTIEETSTAKTVFLPPFFFDGTLTENDRALILMNLLSRFQHFGGHTNDEFGSHPFIVESGEPSQEWTEITDKAVYGFANFLSYISNVSQPQTNYVETTIDHPFINSTELTEFEHTENEQRLLLLSILESDNIHNILEKDNLNEPQLDIVQGLENKEKGLQDQEPQLQQKIVQAVGRGAVLQKKIESLETKKSQWSSFPDQVNAIEQQIKNLKTQIDAITKAMSDVAVLQKKIESLEVRKSQFMTSYPDQIAPIEKQIKNLQTQIDTIMKEVALKPLHKEPDIVRESQIQKREIGTTNEITLLQKKMKGLEVGKSRLLRRIDDMDRNIKTLQAQIDTITKEVTITESSNKNFDIIQGLENKEKELQDQGSQLQQKIAEVMGRGNVLQKKIESLETKKSQWSSIPDQVNAIEQQIQSLQTQLDAITKAMNNVAILQKKIENLEIRKSQFMTSHPDQIAPIEKQIKNLQTQIDTIMKEVAPKPLHKEPGIVQESQIQKREIGTTNKITLLQKKMMGLEVGKSRLSRRIDDMDRNIKTLQAQIDTITKEVTITESSNKNFDIVQGLENKEKELQDQGSQLQQKIAEVMGRGNVLQKKIESLETKKSQWSSIPDQVNAIEQQIKNLKTQIDAITKAMSDVAILQKKIENLEIRKSQFMTSHPDQIAPIEEQIKNLQTQIDTIMKEMAPKPLRKEL